ncbi:hypothetical protein Tco_0064980 [Tanacetum coccineum]
MRTRSQSRNSNRQQQQVHPTFVEPFNLVEPIENQAPPVVTMDDNRTMAQLLEAPTVGYEDAIVVPEITADNFELKHGLLTLSLSLEYEHVAMNLTMLERGRFIIRTSLTGFPAQSVRSSNADALDSLYLLWWKEQVYLNSVLTRLIDDLLALDSIVRFDLSEQRLEQTATFSIPTISDGCGGGGSVDVVSVVAVKLEGSFSLAMLSAQFYQQR